MSSTSPFVATFSCYLRRITTLAMEGQMRGQRFSYQCGDEPRLDDVLDDPVIQAVMTRDGVERHDIVDLAVAVRQKFGARPKNPACCGFE